jgi:hypothetical protein
MLTEYKPGDEIPWSGIYRVTHAPAHMVEHEVTCIQGKLFPPCRDCDHPRFVLVHAADHVEHHEHFGTWELISEPVASTAGKR